MVIGVPVFLVTVISIYLAAQDDNYRMAANICAAKYQ
jgi:hypothetical protein